MNKSTNNQTATKAPARKVRATKAPANKAPASNKGLASLTAKEQARAASQVAASIPMLTGYRNTLDAKGKVAGYKNLGLETYQAAYTHAVFVHLGMVDYTAGADHVTKGSKGRDRGTLRAFLGNTAPGYWVKQEWLQADAQGLYTVTAKGLNILNERIKGQSTRQAFNTAPDSVKAVLAWIRNGKGDKAVSFHADKVSIKA
jgi:hypothetical protein